MRVKTNELTGAALDWAVNQIEECCDDPTTPPFSTDWAQGGPIIEREGINLDNYGKNPRWSAWTPAPERESGEAQAYGPTPLIAAMRCYVASTLGDEVEIPEELK